MQHKHLGESAMNIAKTTFILIVGAMLQIFSLHSLAAGPDSIAKSDRSLWPEALDSEAAYNRASRAEILVFTHALINLTSNDDATLMSILHIKSVDRTSVQRVRDRLSNRLFANYKTASKGCMSADEFCIQLTSVSALLEASENFATRLPDKYAAWFANASTFHRLYAAELIRLAALFSKVSSEIDTYGTGERTGFELADGHFLLTFDDGPSNSGGTTDKLLPILQQYGLHGTFYLLGERLQKRLKSDSNESLKKLYDGQCLALHGWLHNSHQKWDQWQTSVLDTKKLVQETWPQSYRPYFRPPYGQRLANSSSFFASNKLTVALWNIDSQDWNAKVSEHDVAQRVLSLMLVWRSGVILFHDVHTKAAVAVPWLIKQTSHSGITWDDCHQY
jgi:peptidoglycan/xylan/chitin deacetylase (PgdA/CDA1 family)